MTINDGGPAFPLVSDNGLVAIYGSGMTLRDYFAIRASENDIEQYRGIVNHIYAHTREQARYLYADAMLAARSAQPGGGDVR